MPFEAYKIYQEYEPDKYKTSTEQKVVKALEDAKKEGLAGGEESLLWKEAKEILGEDFLGPEEVKEVFGITIEEVPAIPFSQAELERAKELGQQLILQVETMTEKTGIPASPPKNVPLTLLNLKKKFTK